MRLPLGLWTWLKLILAVDLVAGKRWTGIDTSARRMRPDQYARVAMRLPAEKPDKGERKGRDTGSLAVVWPRSAVPIRACRRARDIPYEAGTTEDFMTPQERQRVAQLFERLAQLENSPRERDAEQLIAEGLRYAPNSPYAMVQTILIQEEALERANERIRELEVQTEG